MKLISIIFIDFISFIYKYLHRLQFSVINTVLQTNLRIKA